MHVPRSSKSTAPLTRFRLTRQDLRLGSGLILFVYVAAHFTNHALGLISLATAERGLRVAVAVWHSWPGTVLLYGAAGIHIALAFLALYEHRTLRMPPMEALRIVLGFAIPTLLIAHAVTTRLAFETYGAQPDYARIVWMLWHSNREGRQMALLVPGWLHGCLGLNFAFGRRVWFQRMRLILFGAALLLPVLATLGFLEMLKEVSILAQDPAWFGANVLSLDAAQTGKLAQTSDSHAHPVLRLDRRGACRAAASWHGREFSGKAGLDHLSRAHRACAARLDRTRGESQPPYSAPFDVWRARPMLDLPRAHRRWRAISARRQNRMNSTPSTVSTPPKARGSRVNCDRKAMSP